MSKKTMAELKSYKMPPTPVLNVCECICLIFNRKPSYENFLKLSAESNHSLVEDFIKNYDLSSTSDYVTNELKKYFQSAEFGSKKIKPLSHAAWGLYEWIKLVYESSKVKNKVTFNFVKFFLFFILAF